MTFDPTINVGQVLEFGGFVLGIIAAFFGMREGQKSLGQRLDKMEDEMGRQTNILVDMAKQGVRIDDLQRRVGNLEWPARAPIQEHTI